MKEYESHPAANLFPMLPKEEMKELADDIKAHGLLCPIILLDGKILDGRNRYVACGMADAVPYFRNHNGDCSPVEYVLATNLKRRQLTPSQRATVAAEALPMLEVEAKERMLKGKADPTEKIPGGEARSKAAKMANVNPRYVSDAKNIKEKSPEVFKQVATGEKTIAAAKKELHMNAPAKETNRLMALKTLWQKCSDSEQTEFLKWTQQQKG